MAMLPYRVIARDRADLLGEGPLWSPAHNALFWVDIIGQRLNRLDLASDAVTEWAVPDMIGWVIERAGGQGFIAGLRSGFARIDLEPFVMTALAVPPDHPPTNRLNDAKADDRGRIFAGSMPTAIDRASGNLYRLDPDGTVHVLDRGYTVANGPAISPDGCVLYHTDSVLGRIYRFPIDAEGNLGERSLFRQFHADEGKPDGMTFDTDGGLWVALWGAGRVVRLLSDGRIDQEIALPASQISSCTFAGLDLDRMFVTSAAADVDEPHGGALFEVKTGRKGFVPHRFGG
ncbi:SMP-30/gluconolactonase/LRE family protein [Porphyrobacter sp. TH134]|uniref:SMP-30/gluconolactonase/LRE family protein n=1 Tax=Porphyrobacter sp. TH134 TaxID=2067450 RepID=UPI00269788B2|nr:SMP-30/gluconolactonase/LRE family protein [Porphyrobacter sp. TH134]